MKRYDIETLSDGTTVVLKESPAGDLIKVNELIEALNKVQNYLVDFIEDLEK